MRSNTFIGSLLISISLVSLFAGCTAGSGSGSSGHSGKSWTFPSSLSDNVSPAGQDAYGQKSAMDATGDAIIVWVQSDGFYSQIFKAEYRGGAWSYPTSLADNISPDGGTADSPQVAMDANGNAIIVWFQFDGANWQVFKAEYRSGSWSFPSTLADKVSLDNQDAYYPQVAMDAGGRAIITWAQSDGTNQQIFKAEYRGGSWSFPSSLADKLSPDGQDAQYPQVAMADGGDAIIAWQQSDNSNTQIFKAEYRSGVWNSPSGLDDNISPNGQDASGARVAMDTGGDAIVTWQQSDSSFDRVFRAELRGGTWTLPSSLSDYISPGDQDADDPQAAMDAGGDAIITWAESDGANTQTFKSEYRGGTWTGPASLTDNISPDLQDAESPQVAMDTGGDAIITWAESDGTNTQIFKAEYRGGAWTDPAALTDNISPDLQDASSPQVAMAAGGDAIIAWSESDGSNTRIFKAQYH